MANIGTKLCYLCFSIYAVLFMLFTLFNLVSKQVNKVPLTWNRLLQSYVYF